jgi:single-stranded DNA-binding protein
MYNATTLQKGQLVALEGILRYREVEDEVKGTTFNIGSSRSMLSA